MGGGKKKNEFLLPRRGRRRGMLNVFFFFFFLSRIHGTTRLLSCFSSVHVNSYFSRRRTISINIVSGALEPFWTSLQGGFEKIFKRYCASDRRRREQIGSRENQPPLVVKKKHEHASLPPSLPPPCEKGKETPVENTTRTDIFRLFFFFSIFVFLSFFFCFLFFLFFLVTRIALKLVVVVVVVASTGESKPRTRLKKEMILSYRRWKRRVISAKFQLRRDLPREFYFNRIFFNIYIYIIVCVYFSSVDGAKILIRFPVENFRCSI